MVRQMFGIRGLRKLWGVALRANLVSPFVPREEKPHDASDWTRPPTLSGVRGGDTANKSLPIKRNECRHCLFHAQSPLLMRLRRSS
jgi:hypothetical protein